MNGNRFTELLNRYLTGTASAEERDELMSMIHEGHHDEQIHRRIQSMFSDRQVDEHMKRETADEILKSILASGRERRQVAPSARTHTWRWYAAAAVLIAFISAGWWVSRTTAPTVEVATVPVDDEPESVTFTGKQFVRLPDGSKVLLNEGSQLTYEPAFGENDREVKLVGEGYFDVRRDVARPFRVHTGKVTTTVLGTTFNITAYPEEQEVKVTVTQGKVQVDNNDRLLGIISPDEQISVNTVTNSFVQRSVKAESVSAWQSQYLILDDVSLEEAVRTIAAKYDVRISLVNDALKSCRISATFLRGENLDQVLTVVSGVVQATYSIDGNGTVKVDGKGCQ